MHWIQTQIQKKMSTSKWQVNYIVQFCVPLIHWFFRVSSLFWSIWYIADTLRTHLWTHLRITADCIFKTVIRIDIVTRNLIAMWFWDFTPFCRRDRLGLRWLSRTPRTHLINLYYYLINSHQKQNIPYNILCVYSLKVFPFYYFSNNVSPKLA